MDSRGPEVTLRKAENPWRPGWKEFEKAKNLSEEEAKTEELIKTFKAILNKLTPQNFQKLMAKTLQLPIDNEERLTAIVDLVFEKAITESAYSKWYANMCRVLSQIKVPAADASGLVQFRTILINRCQRAFEAQKNDEGTFAEMKKDIDKLELGSEIRTTKEEELSVLQEKAKQKVLGNMRFICELFKQRMLTEPIMHECIFKLLRAKDDVSLECVSQLMNTVGKDLDHERAKNRMDQYFNQMAKIVRNKKVPAKIRFLLQDLQDLRKSKWIPRKRYVHGNGRIWYDMKPKTIAQIHREAKQEEQQKKMESQMNLQHHARKSREKSRRGKPSPPSPGDDWLTVTATNKGRPHIDPSKLINLGRNRPETDNVQLGPGGRPGAFGSWGRGSPNLKYNKQLESTLQKSKTDPIALLQKELGFMSVRKDKCDNDNVFDWIKKNIDPELTKQKDFIRALVTAVCQSTIEGESTSIHCDPELLKVRAKCLLRYIDGDQDKELQALYAVQALNHKLVNPPGFLRIIFDILYDEAVISVPSFYTWQESKDPAEQSGKGIALESTTSFFAWLGEQDEAFKRVFSDFGAY